MLLKRLITSLIFLCAVNAHAVVDMKNANFSDFWVDLVVPGSGYDLKISRSYSSRSLFSGIFGFGWCSNLESSINITLEGNLILTDCNGPSTAFYPASYNTQIINESVDRIITLLKRKDPSRGAKAFEDLREQMRADHKLRSQLAGEVGVKIVPIKNTVYLANGKEVDRIVYDGTYFARTLTDGSQQRFDGRGRLINLTDKAKNSIKISYNNELPSQIADNQGRKISLTYSTEKKIKQIVASNGLIVNYKFQGENLIGLTNAWKNVYGYNYDNNHNLTKITFPDGTMKTISYVDNKDWVEEFKDRDGCVESFNFELSKESPKDHYWSTSTKMCKGKLVSKNRYEFWYQVRADKEKYLSRALTERNGEVLDISYHQDFGKPISIKRNGDITTLQYLNNGLVKTKAVTLANPPTDEPARYSILFTYDNDNRVVETNSDYFNKQGKALRKKKTNFKYDNQGRLASARSADGQFVDLTYNTIGLIASITDQAKKELVIEYDKATQKPSMITRPSVGSIQLIYGANGEIKKVKAKAGGSASGQIYSAFNNFVDMVGPASSELNLNI